MKKNKVIYAMLVLLFLFLMIMYDGWQTEVLFLMVVFLPLILGIVAFYYSRKVKIYFDEVEEYCQRDNHINKYIMVRNDTRFAIPRIELKVCIEDYMGQKVYRTLVLNSESLTIRNFSMEMSFEHYGMMTIRLEKVRIYDYFGIFSFRKKPKLQTVIYVFPDYSENVHISETRPLPDGMAPEIQYGRKGSDRSEVMENDEYHEGDDIRNIHWKLSSKSDNLIVKHFGDPKEEHINIYVDLKVDKDSRYDCCDGILSALYAVVSSCEQRGFGYKIWGCNGEELIATDLRNVVTGIGEGDTAISGYQCIDQIRKCGGTGICITTAPIDTQKLDSSIKCVNYYWQKDKKKTYEIDGDTVFQVTVEPQDKCEKDFFIRKINDKIRTHQKINYHKYSDKYLPLQAVIALLASVIAVLSIHDVIYIRISGVMQAMFAVLFVIMHYIIYYLTMDMEENAGRVRWRTILILCGYGAVVLIAGPGNIIEGVYSVIDLFQETLVAKGEYYGFLEFGDPYINWLLLLVTFAVVDVIFNFCADFVLGIHLLVVIPLLSICMIVGSMPPPYIALMAGIYLPLIFVVHNSVRHGKSRSRKYLSDDYIYTGNIAVSTGVFTIIVSVVVLAASMMFVHAGGYETPEWIRQGKKTITRLMNMENWHELLSVRSFEPAFLTEDTDGWLDDTKKVEYTGEIVMEVVVSGDIEDGFYLKEYAGTHYNEKAWLERTQTEIQEEEEYMRKVFEEEDYEDVWNILTSNDPYGVADFREYYAFRQAAAQYDMILNVWAEPPSSYTMTITTSEEQMNSIPQPYYSDVEGVPLWGDGYLYGVEGGSTTKSYEEETEGYGTYFTYYGYEVEGVPDIAGISEKYGDYPHIVKNTGEDEQLSKRAQLEEYYSVWIENNYLEVVPELKDEMEQFQNVKVVCGSTEYNLAAGDRQYLDIGYEPYIQYVRKFFEEQEYVYNLSITRKNNYNDFISDFMMRKTGYCIHFASTAVMMFRTMGIPARYAEGYYVTKEHNKGTAPGGILYEVPDSAAHAWVEIYCHGVGWVPVEVTPGSEEFVVTPELITLAPEQEESTTRRQEETTKPSQTTTAAPKETVTAEETTTKNEPKKELKKPGDYWEFFVPVVFVMLALIHYQWKTERLRKSLVATEKGERIKALDAYFDTVTRHCYKGWKEYETNEQKAEYLIDHLPMEEISAEQVQEILELLDKIRYAPVESVTDEELNHLQEFLTIYGRAGYEQVKVHEKFAFKYIKCLYLKAK